MVKVLFTNQEAESVDANAEIRAIVPDVKNLLIEYFDDGSLKSISFDDSDLTQDQLDSLTAYAQSKGLAKSP